MVPARSSLRTIMMHVIMPELSCTKTPHASSGQVCHCPACCNERPLLDVHLVNCIACPWVCSGGGKKKDRSNFDSRTKWTILIRKNSMSSMRTSTCRQRGRHPEGSREGHYANFARASHSAVRNLFEPKQTELEYDVKDEVGVR